MAPRSDNVSHESQERIVRSAEVSTRTGLSRRTLFRLVKANEFPAPYRLTDSLLGWRETDVNHWIDSRPKLTVEVPVEK
ncbi:helix-turn-helix transcriptional regulator [Cupriavidus sp. D39]|uniref:helix-turn-helix transcriptional regulator n=1 Tax=Cupriavidus sp. D39 TaxID=2997877 RepID=UPI003B64225B